MNGKHDTPSGIRGAAYIRVSDGDKQDPERQREMIRAWVTNRGLTITRWYEDIRGRNPRDKAADREQFQLLMRDIEAGLVDWVVVDSQDRFGTSNQFEFGHYIHRMIQHDCQLWSVAQGLMSSTDDAAIFCTTVGNVTSTREQREKGQRAISSKRRYAALGEWQGGYVPYGYDVVCLDDATQKERWRVVILRMVPEQDIWNRVIVYPDGRQERCDGKDMFPKHQTWEKLRLAPTIIEERQRVVRDLFRQFASGSWTVRGMANRLNRAKVDPVVGLGWYNTRLKPMLQNPVYHVGQTVYGKNSHGRHAWYVGGEYLVPPKQKGKPKAGRRNKESDWVFPPAGTSLVEKDLWAEVQARLNSTKTTIKRGLRDDKLWLAGLVLCGHCGAKMTGSSQGGPNYRCTNYVKFGSENPHGCRLHRVRQEQLEERLGHYLAEVGPEMRLLLEGRQSVFVEDDRGLGDMVDRVRALRERIASAVGLEWDGESLIESTMLTLYRKQHAAEQPKVEHELRDAEAQLRNLILGMNRLPSSATAAIEVQQQLIHDADAKVRELRDRQERLDEQLTNAKTELLQVCRQISEAQQSIKGDDNRRKALTLRKVLEQIVCRFDHFDHKTRDPRATTKTVQRSTLKSVEFVPVQGRPQGFTTDNQPARG